MLLMIRICNSKKADFPIDVTLFESVIDDNDTQYRKADSSIDETLFEKVIDDNDMQFEKAESPIDLTFSGTLYDVSFLPDG